VSRRQKVRNVTAKGSFDEAEGRMKETVGMEMFMECRVIDSLAMETWSEHGCPRRN
jgi:hypothetical protein